MTIPILGLPKFPSGLVYQYNYTESISHSIQTSGFQSGISVRNRTTSNSVGVFRIKLTGTTDTMAILRKFYNDVGGPLKPFIFEPPIELLSNQYTQLLSDGSQTLEEYEDNGLLRAGAQSRIVMFPNKLEHNLFAPGAEKIGLILEEVLGEDDKGKYIHFDGLLESQNAVIADFEQDFLDLGTKDFMFDFMFRGETVFLSGIASYAGLTGDTLIFTIDGDTHTVTFTASAVDAASVVEEINDQQGDFVEAQVFGTTELKIRTTAVDGYFTISGTAFAGLDLAAPVIYPTYKHDGVDTGYYFKQDGVGDLTFFLEDGTTARTITADSSFHLLDGSWHYIAVVCDRSGNGQIYIDSSASGAAVDISAANLSLDNTEDFSLHRHANLDIDMDRVGVWSWDAGDLPADIANRIVTMFADLFRIDNEDGLQVLWPFDESTGDDRKQQEDLTLNNNPSFVDFAVQP